MPRSYDPLDSYGGKLQSGSSGSSSGIVTSPLLPRSTLGAPDVWRLIAVLDGDKDDHFTHVVSTTDISTNNGNFEMRFAHGLSITPSISASFTVETDDAKRQLPFWFHSAIGTSYFAATPSLYVGVDRVDDTFIYVRAVIYDLKGLSYLSTNTLLKFKFHCFQDSLV